MYNPKGSMYTTIMDFGPKNHNGDGLLGPNSTMVVYTLDPKTLNPKPTYMDPLGTWPPKLNPGLKRPLVKLWVWRLSLFTVAQRTQYPLIKEYAYRVPLRDPIRDL